MAAQSHDISQLLQKNGYSLTRQRLAVFEFLVGREPLSLVELHAIAGNAVDRASLYRIMAVFERIGAVRRVNIGWKYKYELSDLFAEHHHHLTCLSCHTILPLNAQKLERFVADLAADNAFQPVEHQIEIQGYCRQCAVRG